MMQRILSNHLPVRGASAVSSLPLVPAADLAAARRRTHLEKRVGSEEGMQRLLLGACVCAGGLVAATGLGAPLLVGEAASQPGSTRESSLAAWERIATVLKHPRCVSCHHPDAPLVGDASRPHLPRVVRGRDNQGAPGMRCGSCHGERSNNESSNVPGAADWKLPPRTMMWATMSAGDMCRSIKNPARNGGRSLQGLLKHATEDSLIQWAWDPGARRESVPMPLNVFIDFFDEWVRTGAHCPN
jgi:hypothetical protein